VCACVCFNIKLPAYNERNCYRLNCTDGVRCSTCSVGTSADTASVHAVQMVCGSCSLVSHCSRRMMNLVTTVTIPLWSVSCYLTHCCGKVTEAAA